MGTGILLALPAYGGTVSLPTLTTTHALMQAFMTRGIAGGVATFSYPDVGEARNIMMTAWYDTTPQYSHMLFIDSDMGFSAQVVMDMLLFNEPMVGALYPRKVIPTQWAASGLGEKFAERRGDFMKVAGLGMGCFLIRRDAIDKMIEKMPEIVDTNMEYHSAKDMIPKRIIRAFDGMENPTEGGRLSEDLAFCCRWRQCGGDVWASIGHTIEHVGSYSYKANYMEIMAAKAAAGEVVSSEQVPPEMKVAAE